MTPPTLTEQCELIRHVEERLSNEYRTGKIKTPIHLCLGQEAICVAVCALLRPVDLLFSYYRSHGWYLAKGGNLNAMVAELYGRSDGCSSGVGGSMHLVDESVGFMGTTAIVGAQFAHAVGAALAIKLKGEDRLVACVFGDGAIEQGCFAEAVRFSDLHDLNICFICIDDSTAAGIPISKRQPANGANSWVWVDDAPVQMLVKSLECLSTGSRLRLIRIKSQRTCPHVGPCPELFDYTFVSEPIRHLVNEAFKACA